MLPGRTADGNDPETETESNQVVQAIGPKEVLEVLVEVANGPIHVGDEQWVLLPILLQGFFGYLDSLGLPLVVDLGGQLATVGLLRVPCAIACDLGPVLLSGRTSVDGFAHGI